MIGNLFAFYVLIHILYENVFTPKMLLRHMACMGPPPRGAGWVTLSIQVCSVLPLLLEWQRVSLLHTLPNLGTQMCCVATILSRLTFISTGECLNDVSWER